jgi:hypothetical protein
MRHYKQVGLSIIVAAGLSAVGAARSTADTIYTYTGNSFDETASPYATGDRITGFFDLATPLANNLPPGTVITPKSFSFTDDVQTITPTTPGIVIGSFSVGTDSSGTPDFWDIFFNPTGLGGCTPITGPSLVTCNAVDEGFLSPTSSD